MPKDYFIYDDVEELDYADFGQRFAARIIDTIVIILFLFVIITLFYPHLKSFLDSDEEVSTWIAGIGIFLYFFGPGTIRTIYNSIFEASPFQASPGKIIVGLKVVKPYGEKPSLIRVLWRNISKAISAIIFYIGFLMVLFNRDRQALHDILSKTHVVREKQDFRKLKNPIIVTISILAFFLVLPNFMDEPIPKELSPEEKALKEELSKLSRNPKPEIDSVAHRVKIFWEAVTSEIDKEDRANISYRSSIDSNKILLLVNIDDFFLFPDSTLLIFTDFFVDHLEFFPQTEHKEKYIGIFSYKKRIKAVYTEETGILTKGARKEMLYPFFTDGIYFEN